jgi:hypothetical protein
MVKFDNTDAIYKEYPFLEKIAPRRKIFAAKAARFEAEMFRWCTVGTGTIPGSIEYSDFHLLDSNGNFLKTVGKWCFIPFDQTIADAVRALGKKGKRVKYFVHVDQTLVTLYKTPNQYGDITEWLEEVIAREIADWQL